MHKLHTIFGSLVHVFGVPGGTEHSARRAKNIENSKKWPKLHTLMVGANGAHVRLGPGYALELEPSPMCPTYLLRVAQTPPVLGMAGSPSKPMIWNCPPFAHLVALVCQAQEEVLARSKICGAPKKVL